MRGTGAPAGGCPESRIGGPRRVPRAGAAKP